ncbi:unnamed protein product [Wickerhamomyces anomalus]
MSDHFTDTNKYASSLNLANNGDNSRSNSNSEIQVNNNNNNMNPSQNYNTTIPGPRNYPPLQPNIQQSPSLPQLVPLRPHPPNQSSVSPQAQNASPPTSGPKKRASTSTDTKSRKKQNSKSDDDKLNTLANLASSSNQQQQQATNKQQQQPQPQPAGHRPVTSCTHCRQHKIKCNASERFPAPCQRCEKMGLTCEIDPQFRPKKGSQIQSLRNDVDELKLKIEYLQRNESLIAQALANQQTNTFMRNNEHAPSISSPLNSLSGDSPPGATSVKTILKREPHLLMDRRNSQPGSRQSSFTKFNTSTIK